MVSRDSATHVTAEANQDDIFSIDANHFEIVKFDRQSPDFLRVMSRVVGLVDNVQAFINRRLTQQNGMFLILWKCGFLGGGLTSHSGIRSIGGPRHGHWSRGRIDVRAISGP